MTTHYTFSVSLFDASKNPNGLQVWQSGTLTLDTSSATSVTGALTLAGFYKEPIAFNGTVVPSNTSTGTTVDASGESSEAQITFTIAYNYDGFLYNGSYLGGLVSVLDYSAQETYLYVIQGLSSQGPFGATLREGSGGADKRKPPSA
jgi:hypothetical protein